MDRISGFGPEDLGSIPSGFVMNRTGGLCFELVRNTARI